MTTTVKLMKNCSAVTKLWGSGWQFQYDKAYCFLAYWADRLRGQTDPLPPKKYDFVGAVSFEQIGQIFLDYFTKMCRLRPDERVLDVGCGIGRMAMPLKEYLSERGEYWGFDIVPIGIHWCQKRISPRFPQFHFELVDILNATYNPDGKQKAAEHEFP